MVQRMETCQGDELELVTHFANLLLELGNGGVIQVTLPVEGRRAVVCKQLACKPFNKVGSDLCPSYVTEQCTFIIATPILLNQCAQHNQQKQ